KVNKGNTSQFRQMNKKAPLTSDILIHKLIKNICISPIQTPNYLSSVLKKNQLVTELKTLFVKNKIRNPSSLVLVNCFKDYQKRM
ncbi:unnamed protein product, partial [Coccothraustes coccothraustes]